MFAEERRRKYVEKKCEEENMWRSSKPIPTGYRVEKRQKKTSQTNQSRAVREVTLHWNCKYLHISLMLEFAYKA